jgi:hypothetical protein
MRNPTPHDCDIARKVLLSMDRYGRTSSSEYVSAQETVRICEIREAREWKD